MVGDWTVTCNPQARRLPMQAAYRRHFEAWKRWFEAREDAPLRTILGGSFDLCVTIDLSETSLVRLRRIVKLER